MCTNLEFVIIYSKFHSQNVNICYHWNFSTNESRLALNTSCVYLEIYLLYLRSGYLSGINGELVWYLQQYLSK